jgi:heme exporter protein D
VAVTRDQAVWLAVGGLAVLCLALLVVTVRGRRSWARERDAVRAEMADLRTRLGELEHDRRTPVAATEAEFVITGLGSEQPEPEPTPSPAPAARVDGAAFADPVLRETVVKACRVYTSDAADD